MSETDRPSSDPVRAPAPLPDADPARAFADEAGQARRGMAAELLGFLADNKVWWLTPVVVVLLLLALLMVVGGSAAAPFIYTIF